MAANTIVIGRFSSSDVVGVLGVVRDWTASGLLKPSHWINIDTPDRVFKLSSGDELEFSLADWIAQGASDIAIYVLQPIRDTESLISYADVQAAFKETGFLASELPRLVNVVVPTEKNAKLKASPFFLQQLNYVAEPVDGFMPNQQAVQINAKSGFYSQHAAKELATVAGLWPGQAEPGLPNQSKPVGLNPDIVVGRSFLRYVDASALVTSATDQLVNSANDSLPTPKDPQLGSVLETVRPGDERDLVRIAVESFFDAHGDQLKFKKTWPEYRSKVDGLGVWQSLVRFLKWALKKTPELLKLTLQRKLDELKLKVATPVQGLYGFDSKVAVIVGGVSAHNNPNGTSMSGAEILAQMSNNEFDAAASGGPAGSLAQRPVPATPGNLWRDFIEATVGIADGSKPSTGNEAVQFPKVGGRRMVITKPEFIAPDVAKDSFEIPVNIPSAFRGRKLTSDDPLAADVVLLELVELQKNRRDLTPSDRGQLATLQNKLGAWINSNTSFVWKVGEALARQINSAVSAWSTLINELNVDVTTLNDAHERAKTEVVEAYKRFFKGSKYIAGAGGVIWLGQALFLFFTTGAWPILAGNWWVWALIFAGVLLLWNMLGPLVIWDQLKALHVAENAIDDRNERLAYINKIRGLVWEEVFRLNSYYSQYLAWSAIVSPFIHREKSSGGKVSAAKLTMPKSLPNSMSLALIEADKTAANNLAKSLESGFYATGWLFNAVQDSVLAAGFGNEVWIDARATENSDLARLSRAAKTNEFRALVSDGSRGVIEGIAGGSDAYRNSTVKVPTAIDANRTFTGHEFISELATGGISLPACSLFSPIADAQGKRTIDQSRSALFIDGNLTLNSDITKKPNRGSQTVAARKLDFMAIRFEVTKLLEPSDLVLEVEEQKTSATQTESGSTGDIRF
jgi:Putative Actinobacterial Holin-X, holin superfamily III